MADHSTAVTRKGSDSAPNVGARIRALRQQRGLNLTVLARTARLTPSAISQIEHGRLTPSIAAIRRIAQALKIPLFQLFLDMNGVRHQVVRRAARRRVIIPRSKTRYELLSASLRGHFEVVWCAVEPGGATAAEPLSHAGEEECLVVLRGQGEIEFPQARHRLVAGDAITFDCSVPHRLLNIGAGWLEAMFIVAPPAF